MTYDPIKIDKNINEFLSEFEIELLDRYNYYRNMANNKICKIEKRKVSLLDYEMFNVNFSELKEAINKMKMDIKILLMRREKLIGNMRMSEGKIAGIITYRFVKASIIHIYRNCNVCQHKCFLRINNIIAIMIGLDYINKKYTELSEGIRNELFYTIKHRHINQETLGLVFDTLKELKP